MTAPTPDPGLRDKLAEADYMRRRAFDTHTWEQLPEQSKDWWREQVPPHLLPFVTAYVEQQARERAAAELEAAADHGRMPANGRNVLLARVGDLRGQA